MALFSPCRFFHCLENPVEPGIEPRLRRLSLLGTDEHIAERRCGQVIQRIGDRQRRHDTVVALQNRECKSRCALDGLLIDLHVVGPECLAGGSKHGDHGLGVLRSSAGLR